MPQMSPLSWSTLYIYFSTIMITFIITNYFLVNYNVQKNTKNKKNISINWKW